MKRNAFHPQMEEDLNGRLRGIATVGSTEEKGL